METTDPITITAEDYDASTAKGSMSLSLWGMCYAFAPTRYFAVSGRTDQPVLTVRGSVDMYGVLAHGTVAAFPFEGNSPVSVDNVYRFKDGPYNIYYIESYGGTYATPSVAVIGNDRIRREPIAIRLDTGYYCVLHGVGHQRYNIIATIAIAQAGLVSVANKHDNAFYIKTYNTSGQPLDLPFDYSIIGHNK